MKKEDQLQAKIVLDFSQKRPEDKGCLWSVPNRTLSQRDGQKQVAMGLVKGVSDLIYFKEGRFVGIELKLIGKTHKKTHVQKQLDWGKKIESEGGEYYIVTSIEGFWEVINQLPFPMDDVYTTKQIEELIEISGSVVIF